MREKLLDLMKNEGLKPSQLAELLEINPAGISHILAGRNKPGFDLLQKILKRFPRINPDWLLLDSDKMYRDDIPAPQPIAPSTQQGEQINDGLFSTSRTERISATPNRPATSATSGIREGGLREGQESAPQETAKPGKVKSAVERIVIFYEDLTFESFTPTKF